MEILFGGGRHTKKQGRNTEEGPRKGIAKVCKRRKIISRQERGIRFFENVL